MKRLLVISLGFTLMGAISLQVSRMQEVAHEIENYENLILAEKTRLARGGTYSENSQEYMKELLAALEEKQEEYKQIATQKE